MKKISVNLIFRKPFPQQFSIEQVFGILLPFLNKRKDLSLKVFQSKYHSKGLTKRLWNILEAKKLKNTVHHITGDIYYLTAGLPGNRTIITIHDLAFLNYYKGLNRKLIELFWVKMPIKKAAIITTISEATKKEILSVCNIPADKIRVIPNPVDPEFKKDIPCAFREKPVILQIGTKWNKNVERLILALKDIPCHLNIVGPITPKQTDLLNKHKIDFRNHLNLTKEEIINLYKKADIVSFVSLIEGFGLPILEANAVGRPVITSNISSMPEVADKAACLVNPYDVQSIREGILKVITDENYRNQLVKEGFENVKRFDPQRIAQMYFDIYKELSEKNK